MGIGNAAHGNQSYYFGKMDFWTSNAFDGSRHEWTHVAPAFVELSFESIVALRDATETANSMSTSTPAPTPPHPISWSATQALYEPMLNTTIAGGTAAEVKTSAVFAPETNLMTVRIKSAAATTLSLRLSTQLPSACSSRTSCMADLPMHFAAVAESNGGASITMQREANHWVHNEAVLVECDPRLIPTMGERRFSLTTDGELMLQNSSETDPAAGSGGTRGNTAAECLSRLPASGQHSAARRRPISDTIVSKSDCSATATLKNGWVLTPQGLSCCFSVWY